MGVQNQFTPLILDALPILFLSFYQRKSQIFISNFQLIYHTFISIFYISLKYDVSLKDPRVEYVTAITYILKQKIDSRTEQQTCIFIQIKLMLQKLLSVYITYLLDNDFFRFIVIYKLYKINKKCAHIIVKKKKWKNFKINFFCNIHNTLLPRFLRSVTVISFRIDRFSCHTEYKRSSKKTNINQRYIHFFIQIRIIL